jgi:hypothetical protein
LKTCRLRILGYDEAGIDDDFLKLSLFLFLTGRDLDDTDFKQGHVASFK